MTTISAADPSASPSSASVASFQAWWVVLSTASFFFFTFLLLNSFNSLEPLLQQSYHLSMAQVGNLSAYYFYANVLFLLPAGMLLDRFSVRRVVLAAMAVTVLASACFAWSHALWVAVLCRTAMGAAGAFCLLSCVRLASRWFPPARMALVIGVVVTLAMSGGMVAQTPFTLASQAWGWRHALMGVALIGAFFWCVMWFSVRDAPHARFYREEATTSWSDLWRALGQVVRRPQNALAGLYTSLMNLPIFLLGAVWSNVYLMQARMMTAQQASEVSMCLFLGMIVGSPLVGWWSDRVHQRVRPMHVGAWSALLCVLVIMYAPQLSVGVVALLFFLLGLSSATQVITYPLVAESNPAHLTGSAEGLTSMLIMAGGFVQPLFGVVLAWGGAAHAGHYSAAQFQHAFWLLPAGFIISGLICLKLRETHAKPFQSSEG
jgi:MFS family permease